MEVLGKLGIDVWLIVAQIINFVLLLWILKKYVYKPLLTRLEREEKERKQLIDDAEKISQDKKNIDTDREAAVAEAKKKSEEILEEAERIADEVKRTIRTEAEDSKKFLLAQAAEQVKAEISAVRDEEKRKLLETVRGRLGDTIAKMRESGVVKELQRKYVDAMISEIASLTLANSQNVQSVVLECGAAADGGDIERIKNALRDKLGHDIHLETKEREDLIAGFRIEIDGYQLNHNLLEDITYATHNETP